jgi:phosphoribosyl 1,2-cyclic phosphodiesterase
MELCALASGSSGNCFYIGNPAQNKGILVDAGISSKKIIERLEKIGKKPESIAGIFITHEHSDHIRGADVFARAFNTPIFATKKTADKCSLCSNGELITKIGNQSSIEIAGFEVESFSKHHLAEDPVSYSIFGNGKTASVITDLGICCNRVNSAVTDSNFLFLESNHDPIMLENGPYPAHLKTWIQGDYGHLSNIQASLCILEHASKKLKNVVLSHLSQTNNTPEIALNTFNYLIKERRDIHPRAIVSLREKPTELFKL